MQVCNAGCKFLLPTSLIIYDVGWDGEQGEDGEQVKEV